MNKKQLDEKHQKILRKLLTLPENKKCFDCSEKVPSLAALPSLAPCDILSFGITLFILLYSFFFQLSKGPFYACTTLGTFVCTTCSGIQYVL